MPSTFEILVQFLVRVAPGLTLGIVLLFLVRREPRVRIVLYLALFILLRDSMTPLGLWSFGTQGFFWIRLHDDPTFLIVFGMACFGLTIALYLLDRDNQPLVQWVRGQWDRGLLWGVAGVLIVVAPIAVIYRCIPIDTRGGAVPQYLLPAILVFAFLGNLLEEALFRGYVYGQLVKTMTPLSAAVASGIVFAFCHIYLATTVTGLGYPLLAFTLWEGIIAGIVGSKGGVLPATLTHGGAIFLLSSGLI
jgi:membrane protease YdiL (CAAX protease family)